MFFFFSLWLEELILQIRYISTKVTKVLELEAHQQTTLRVLFQSLNFLSSRTLACNNDVVNQTLNLLSGALFPTEKYSIKTSIPSSCFKFFIIQKGPENNFMGLIDWSKNL